MGGGYLKEQSRLYQDRKYLQNSLSNPRLSERDRDSLKSQINQLDERVKVVQEGIKRAGWWG